MNLNIKPLEKTLKLLDENENDNKEEIELKKYKNTKECFENLDETDIDEIYDIFTFVADDPRSLLELVETNPMKYVSVVEHDTRCKELNLPIWTRRINDNLFVKFKVSKNSPPMEVGFSETCDDQTILNDLKTSIKYWLTYDDNQLSIQRRNIALLGNDQHETLSKVGQNDSLIPSNIDSILATNNEPSKNTNSNQNSNQNQNFNKNSNQNFNKNSNIFSKDHPKIIEKCSDGLKSGIEPNLVSRPQKKSLNHSSNKKNIKSQTITTTIITTESDGSITTKTTTLTNTYE